MHILFSPLRKQPTSSLGNIQKPNTNYEPVRTRKAQIIKLPPPSPSTRISVTMGQVEQEEERKQKPGYQLSSKQDRQTLPNEGTNSKTVWDTVVSPRSTL